MYHTDECRKGGRTRPESRGPEEERDADTEAQTQQTQQPQQPEVESIKRSNLF